MKSAILYGADAVYLASDMFGMRAAADNFTLDELSEAVKYAHERNVKLYVTVNTMPHTKEYEILSTYLKKFDQFGVDALIISDLGVFQLARELIPNMEIHVSTQASIVSAAAATAWHKMGAKRVVLARELSLKEIMEIRQNTPPTLELECFIHGSMCISYSGRCLLSNYYTGRDANRGACAQPCRWNFNNASPITFAEEKRPEDVLSLEEYREGSYIMSSKDMCMIEHIPELMESGIDSFKIEGRMKSAYYTAVVTNTYKMAMDSYFSGNYCYDPLWYRELLSVTHRAYNTGYYFSSSYADANTVEDNGYVKEKAYLAVVLEYNKDTGLALMSQRNKMKLGDAAEILTPGSVGKPISVSELYGEDMQPIEATSHPYMLFYMKADFELRAGDILRAAE